MRFSLIPICLLITGCAQYVYWHPAKNQAQVNADVNMCNRQAQLQYPVKIVERITVPERRTADVTECYQYYNRTRCETIPGRVIPARYRTDDVNEYSRQDAYGRCMRSLGYQLREVK